MRALVTIAWGPTLVLALTVPTLGCDFFRELESLPEAGDDASDESGSEDAGTGETGEDPCDIFDDACPSQDTLQRCDPDTGELLTIDCAIWCGSAQLLNFTCSPSFESEFVHGCWCVEPGNLALDSCWQLEECVLGCGGDPNAACTQACFGRTDAQTIRLLGGLYACADRACDALCEASPADCKTCQLLAREGLWGDCSVEREVCDADTTDESGWP